MTRFRTYNQVEGRGAGDVPEQVAGQLHRLADRLATVGAVWLVGSGKGGVGKSAVTANLAAALARTGLRVGALDADLNGPSLARMLDARAGLVVDDGGVHPAPGAGGTHVVSMDLLLDADDAPLRWRGPGAFDFVWQSALETGTLREFLADVAWGDLDVLLLDLPPGTDKLLRAFKLIPEVTGVLLVTTPSEAARSVVARSLRMTRDLGADPIGLVANMTARVCPSCGHAEPLFEADGARRLAEETGGELWAEIPFQPAFARETDAGRPPVLDDLGNDPAASRLRALAHRVAAVSGCHAPAPDTDEP